MSRLIEIVIQSSILILIVLAVRSIFRNRISARAVYAFWMIPLLRLLVPITVSSSFSIMNLFVRSNVETNGVGSEAVHVAQDMPTALQGLTEPITQTVPSAASIESAGAAIAPQLGLHDILLIIWLVGIVTFLCYFAIVNIRFLRALMNNAEKITVETKLPKRTEVFVSSSVASPCVWGIYKKRIVLTNECLKEDQIKTYALMHEAAHIKQCDTLFSLLRILMCAVYWFNPLVWLAAGISRYDCELSCDEKVTAGLSFDEKLSYGHILIRLISKNQTTYIKPYIANTATTMLGGNNMKKRIKRIAEQHKPSKAIAVILSTMMIAVMLIACTTANENPGSNETNEETSIDQADIETEPTSGSESDEQEESDQATPQSEQVSEYTQIVKDFAGYLPTMSRLRGLPIEFALENIETVEVSCDHGAFISYVDDYQSSTRRLWINREETSFSTDEALIYWVPFNSAGTIENTQSAVVNIEVIDINGGQYHQTMRILLDDAYSIFDMPEAANVSLVTPAQIQYKKGNTITVLNPFDLCYTEIAQFAVGRITNVQSVSIPPLDLENREVEEWKRQNDWVELYYPEKYLAGTFVGTDDSRIELMTNTRLLMFLTGQDSDYMYRYNLDGVYQAPVLLEEPEMIPDVTFERISQSTLEQDGCNVTMYAYLASIGGEKNILVRAEIENTGSEEMSIETGSYITLNVSRNGTPVGDFIGEQNTNHEVTIQPGEILDISITIVEAEQNGTYLLAGQFGLFELPSLDIEVK